MTQFGDEYFDYSEFIYVQNISKDNANIEQLIPYIQTTLPASNEDKDIAETQTFLSKSFNKSLS